MVSTLCVVCLFHLLMYFNYYYYFFFGYISNQIRSWIKFLIDWLNNNIVLMSVRCATSAWPNRDRVMSPSGRGSVWVKEFLLWNFFCGHCSGIARSLHANIYVFFMSLCFLWYTQVHDVEWTNVPGKFGTHGFEDRRN